MASVDKTDYLDYDSVKEELRSIVITALQRQREEIARYLETSNAVYQDNSRHLAVRDVLKQRADDIRKFPVRAAR